MTDYLLPYGHRQLIISRLPSGMTIDWIEPAYVPPAADPRQVICEALDHPLDSRPLSSFSEARSVAIAINDKTRPVPHEIILPPLLDSLHSAGIPAAAIQFIIATGTHLPMPYEEFARVLPSVIYEKYRVISHDCDDAENLVFRGKTSRGTPVWINRHFFEADLRMMVGNIEPHHFAGFSGGYKSVAIGLAGRETITANHAMLVEPLARIGEYARNPLRQDIEEIGDAIGEAHALNMILNGEKKIVRAVFGAPGSVMQAGIPISQSVCQIQSPGKYDLVIASAGGAPKDINFYQAQKALTHASLFARDGGVIILAAECPEGSGNRAYEDFMDGLNSPEQVFEKFRQMGFRVGPHKAFQVAREVARVKIFLVSDIDPALVLKLLMTPAGSLEEALERAYEFLAPLPPDKIRAAVLPRATNTIPV